MNKQISSYDKTIHGDATDYVLSAMKLSYGNLVNDIQIEDVRSPEVKRIATVTIMNGNYSLSFIIENKTKLIVKINNRDTTEYTEPITKITLNDHTTNTTWPIYDNDRMINCDHPECAKEHTDWQQWCEFDVFELLHDLTQILTGIYNMELDCFPCPGRIMCIRPVKQ